MLFVTVHEIGHSLGLAHSRDPNSVMRPAIGGFTPVVALAPDDIAGIQRLYGPNPGNQVVPPESPGPSVPDFCLGDRFDAATTHELNGVEYTYIFKSSYYVRMRTATRIDAGYPRLISDGWVGLPADLDAAVYWPRGVVTNPRTYFCKGSMYWRFENGRLRTGYPREISQGWGAGRPNDVDAAFLWAPDSKTYFFKRKNCLLNICQLLFRYAKMSQAIVQKYLTKQ